MALIQNSNSDHIYSAIDTDLIDEILHHKKKGDRLMFLRAHNGHIKIKIKYGPLKCFTKRFVTNNATFEQIKQEMSLSS